MTAFLIKAVDARTPKFNADLADGLSVKHMMETNPATGTNNTRAYIDKLFDINKGLFDPGFEYLGNRICRADQHFDEITREYGGKRIANIAKSDTYMIELLGSYKGEMLMPRRVLLPFVRDGGLCTLNGAGYSVSPVLTDVGFSVLAGTIFIPFGRTKLTFKQVDHHYYCNGEREVMYVIWSQIHNEMGKRIRRDLDNRKRIESSLAHYFFCQFGVIETFKQWAGADIKLGYLKDFPKSDYPSDQWDLYESINLKGRHPTGDMVMLVPKSQSTDFVKRLVAGFWYVVDTFPNRFVEIEDLDDRGLWKVILGLMIFGDFKHQGKIMEDMESHLDSFNKSLDEMTQKELKAVDIDVNTIWELLHRIMTDMVHHLYDSDIDETSMYDKRLSILRFVMAEFNYAVSMFAYAFQGRRDKEWTTHDVNELMKKWFKLNTCVRRLASQHGEFETLSFPGDCKVIKITSILVPQDKARTMNARNRSLIGDSSRLIHASIAEVGQYKNQPKNNPDGRGRLNMFLQVRHDGLVMRNPALRDVIDKAQKRFRAK